MGPKGASVPLDAMPLKNVYFLRQEQGESTCHAVEPKDVGKLVYGSHFLTCPDASSWSGKARKGGDAGAEQ